MTDQEDNKWQKIMEESEQEAPVEEVQEDLNEADSKLGELEDQIVRLKAEVANVQRRGEKQVQDAHKFGATKLLKDMIPVIDSIIHGLELNTGGDPQAEAMKEGLQLTLDAFEKALEKNSVEIINPEKGDAFDPETQQAMGMVPDPKAKSNTILQVLQKGYALNGRTIKAAMVMVAA